MYERGLITEGRRSMGKKRPQRNIMGKRKKLEKVCASNTSLTETAMKRPRNVEETAIKTTAGKAVSHNTLDRSKKNAAMTTGTKALTIPKTIAPEVFESIRMPSGIGARRSLSKDRPFFSNVTVTPSIEVVPKRMEIAMSPGRSVRTPSNPPPDLMKNIPVQARGNMIPQLMLGGLR
jgi:hypothetical protein